MQGERRPLMPKRNWTVLLETDSAKKGRPIKANSRISIQATYKPTGEDFWLVLEAKPDGLYVTANGRMIEKRPVTFEEKNP